MYFDISCDRVAGKDLILVTLDNESASRRFISALTKLLRTMKRAGDIKIYLFESELDQSDKMESVYLINKYPKLASHESRRDSAVFIKL
jgi:hypothetical protein